MEKLTVEDIVILSPNQQIKAMIVDKFGSIESFCEHIGMAKRTVNSYLRSQKIGSQHFRIKLIHEFDLEIDEMYLSAEEQVRAFVENINYSPKNYSARDDVFVLDKLYALCRERDLNKESLMVRRCQAWNYLYTGLREDAIRLTKSIIKVLEEKEYRSLYLQYQSELGMMYYMGHKFAQATAIFEKIEPLTSSEDMEDIALYFYYYGYGLLISDIQYGEKAIGIFEKAFNYAPDQQKKGSAKLNIGYIYMRLERYPEAYQAYIHTEQFWENEITRLPILYANIAEVFRKDGNLSGAKTNINKAMSMVRDVTEVDSYDIYKEYYNIHLHIEGSFYACGKMGSLIIAMLESENTEMFVLERSIDSFIELCGDFSHLKLTEELLEKTIEQLNRFSGNKELTCKLYELIGRLEVKKKERDKIENSAIWRIKAD